MSKAMLLVEPMPPRPTLRASKLQFCARAGADVKTEVSTHRGSTILRNAVRIDVRPFWLLVSSRARVAFHDRRPAHARHYRKTRVRQKANITGDNEESRLDA